MQWPDIGLSQLASKVKTIRWARDVEADDCASVKRIGISNASGSIRPLQQASFDGQARHSKKRWSFRRSSWPLLVIYSRIWEPLVHASGLAHVGQRSGVRVLRFACWRQCASDHNNKRITFDNVNVVRVLTGYIEKISIFHEKSSNTLLRASPLEKTGYTKNYVRATS